jgi:hypothetical protein
VRRERRIIVEHCGVRKAPARVIEEKFRIRPAAIAPTQGEHSPKWDVKIPRRIPESVERYFDGILLDGCGFGG